MWAAFTAGVVTDRPTVTSYQDGHIFLKLKITSPEFSNYIRKNSLADRAIAK